MLARALEAHGIATTSISMVREHTEKLKPPRALFVPFPFGHAFGRPNDPELQHRVLRAALDLFDESAGPVLRDFSDVGDLASLGGSARRSDSAKDEPPAPTQASLVAPSAGVADDPVIEAKQMRVHHAQWRTQNGGRTTFGLSGIPATRFAEAVEFLQRFANGEDAELPERPAGVPLPGFIRWCADDLKAMYYEGRMGMKPNASGDEMARWFWGETAAGQLLRRVRDRLDASADPQWKAAAFGVAR